MNGIGIILISIAAGLVLFGRPVTAALGVMFAVCYITQAQAIDVAGFNFTAIRIVLLVGIVRVLMKRELREMPPSPVDKWLIGYTMTTLLIAAVAQGSEVIPFYIGLNYNVLLAYFVFRALLKSRSDLLEFLSLLALLIVPMACSMLYESATGYNIFKNLGGIKDKSSRARGCVQVPGSIQNLDHCGHFRRHTCARLCGPLYGENSTHARRSGNHCRIDHHLHFKLQWTIDGADKRGSCSWFLAFADKYEDGPLGGGCSPS